MREVEERRVERLAWRSTQIFYGLGFNRSWSVQVLRRAYGLNPTILRRDYDGKTREYRWKGGTPYHYGMSPPRYPVPAVYEPPVPYGWRYVG